MAKFTSYPHSPEQQRYISPEERRDRQVIPLAIGHLGAAYEAIRAVELAPAYTSTPNTIPYEQTFETTSPNPQDATALQEFYRKKAEVAYSAHGTYDYPAEDITPEVRAFREASAYSTAPLPSNPPVAQMYTFPDRMFEANPNIDNKGRQAA